MKSNREEISHLSLGIPRRKVAKGSLILLEPLISTCLQLFVRRA